MPPVTAAERQREFRQRLKHYNIKLKAIKKKNTERVINYYREKIRTLTEAVLEKRSEDNTVQGNLTQEAVQQSDTDYKPVTANDLKKIKHRIEYESRKERAEQQKEVKKLWRGYKLLHKRCARQQMRMNQMQDTIEKLVKELESQINANTNSIIDMNKYASDVSVNENQTTKKLNMSCGISYNHEPVKNGSQLETEDRTLSPEDEVQIEINPEFEYSNVHIKVEPDDQGRTKPSNLYEDHQVQEKLVIGPEVLHRPIPRAAQIYNGIIAETQEKRRQPLSTVPSLWEENGKIRWQQTAEHEEAQTVLPTRSGGQKQKQDQINFDILSENLVRNQESQGTNNNDTTSVERADTAKLMANQMTILSKINTIFDVLKTVIENQKTIALKLAQMSVQNEETNSRLLERRETPTNVTLSKDCPDVRDSLTMPIDDQQELEALELFLSDRAQYNSLRSRLSILCCTTIGGGTTCAYKLLDNMFSREFLCKCSWSGGSRGETSKIALKNFKLIIAFFFDMIHSWDSTFTMEDTDKFFKMVLKNALKRRSMKDLRTSTKRRRRGANKSLHSGIPGQLSNVGQLNYHTDNGTAEQLNDEIKKTENGNLHLNETD